MATLSDFPVAETVVAQLGGRSFFLMTGAKNLVCGPRDVSCKIGGNDKGVTHFRCTLTDADVYHVQFLRCRGVKVTTVAEHDDVYAEDLARIFTAETGLCLVKPRFV